MFPKKLCALGILDININLVLRKSLAENIDFDISKYNTVEDLESLFFKNNDKKYNNEKEKNEKINYYDYISLSSDNNLINTLLFINRAYKTKTFIEFIMLNQMEFSESTKFVRKFLQEIFDKNYFFIVENKILDIPSKIKFNIKILNNDNDQIISKKSFELFEINEMEVEQQIIANTKIEEFNSENNDKYNDNNYFFERKIKYLSKLKLDTINYNFEQTDYFLFDLSITKDFKFSKYNVFSSFLLDIIKTYRDIKIILIIDDNINSVERENLKLNKKLIELSDIIFSFQEKLNNFFKVYNSTMKNKSKKISNYDFINFNENIDIIGNQKQRKYDLIIDDMDKIRKNIPRTTIIFKDFSEIIVCKQTGIQMRLDDIEIFQLEFSNIKNKEKMECLLTNSELFYHIFIGGFLSRWINEKSLRVCVNAGDLLVKNNIYLFMNKIDYINDIDQYNVLVPSIKKSIKRKIIEKMKKEYEKLLSKENKFILDCTNIIKSKKKDYNPLYDENCASYLLKNQNMKHLKNVGFINKDGVILKDPDITRHKFKRKNSIRALIKNSILKENNFFLRNHRLPYSQTINDTNNNINTINSDTSATSKKNKKKFKPIFKSIFEKSPLKNVEYPDIKTMNSLPKMSKTHYFPKKPSKKLGNHENDLKKSNNILINIEKFKKTKARNLSYYNGRTLNRNHLYIMYKTSSKNFFNFKKSLSNK